MDKNEGYGNGRYGMRGADKKRPGETLREEEIVRLHGPVPFP
jgi:hypothetical protein